MVKILEKAVIVFLAIAFVRFVIVCLNRDNDEAFWLTTEAEPDVLRNIRTF